MTAADFSPKDGVKALCAVTGLSPAKVRAGIRDGSLPGYVIGRSFIVPADALERFANGLWVPRPRIVQAKPRFIHERGEKTA